MMHVFIKFHKPSHSFSGITLSLVLYFNYLYIQHISIEATFHFPSSPLHSRFGGARQGGGERFDNEAVEKISLNAENRQEGAESRRVII
jgi:hypothetical protein